jgi:hypothetical protein
MEKEYSQDEIRKGFRNLALLRLENSRLISIVEHLRDELKDYHAREVGAVMLSLGYTEKEAKAVLVILDRCLEV